MLERFWLNVFKSSSKQLWIVGNRIDIIASGLWCQRSAGRCIDRTHLKKEYSIRCVAFICSCSSIGYLFWVFYCSSVIFFNDNITAYFVIISIKWAILLFYRQNCCIAKHLDQIRMINFWIFVRISNKFSHIRWMYWILFNREPCQ